MNMVLNLILAMSSNFGYRHLNLYKIKLLGTRVLHYNSWKMSHMTQNYHVKCHIK